jgi:catechol 2,3-dioxygenase
LNPYRLDPGVAVGPVHLNVQSLDRSLALYHDVLGLEPHPRSTTTVALSVPGEHPLVLLTEDPSAPPKPSRAPGLYHMAILVPSRADLGRILLRLSHTGYAVQGASDHGVSEAVYLADPEGNGIEIYHDRPRDEWPTANGGLRMVTEAMDVDGVLGAVSEPATEGAGLPEGTRIGHVHLQVSDIKASERFYGDVLGLDLMQRYGPSASFFSAAGYHHHIGMNTWMSAGAAPPPDRATGLRYFTLLLSSRAALDELLTHLSDLGIAMESSDSGQLIRDPSHNGILLATS